MKKQHRIVSLLLVMTLIFSSFIFIGKEAGVTAAAAASDFTPTATIAAFNPSNINAVTNTAANHSGTANLVAQTFNNGKGEFDFYTVTRADGSDYLQIVTNKTGDATGHIQWTFEDKSGKNLFYNADKNQYIVYEVDLSTEGELTALGFITNPMSKRNNQTWLSGFSANNYRDIHIDDLGIKAGEFTHLTVAYDVNNNMCYVYTNNGLVKSMKYTSDAAHKAWREGSTAYVENGHTYNFAENGMRLSFKLQAHSSYTYSSGGKFTPLTKGESILADNAYLSIYDSTTVGNLPSVLGSDLSGWDKNRFNADYDLPAVPDLAEIDGVRYNNIPDANQELGFALAPKNVTLLRETKGELVIGCDANLTTNGITTYTLADGCTTSINTDGSIKVDFPFVPIKEVSGYTVDRAAIWKNLKYSANDNVLTSVSVLCSNVEGGWGNVGAHQTNFITNTMNGNTIVHEAVNGALTGSNEYLQIDFNNGQKIPFYATQGKNTYVVIELDFNLAAANGSTYPLQYIHRTSSGGSLWGNVNVDLTKCVPEDNEMHHLSIVYDYQTNKAYVFTDGVLFYTVEDKGVYSPDAAVLYADPANGIHLESIRLGSNSKCELYFDNMYARVEQLDSAADGIAASITAKNTDAWDGFLLNNPDFVPSEFPPVAAVGTTICNKASDLEAALVGTERVIVSLFDNISKSVKIDCPAIINRNGYTISYTLGDGYTAVESGDNIIVSGNVDEKENIQIRRETDGAKLLNITKYTHTDNKFTSYNLANYNASAKRGTFVKESTDGSWQVAYSAPYDSNGVPSNANTYMEWSTSDTTAQSLYMKNKYFLVDFDMAYDSYEDLTIEVVVRNSSGGNVATTFNITPEFLEAGIKVGEFAHVTILGDTVNKKVYVFINGISYGENVTTLNTGTGYYLNAIRLGQNQSARIAFDNILIRFTGDATLANAISNKNIASATSNIYNSDYIENKMAKYAAIATVDGTDYYTYASLEAALAEGDRKNVSFRHTPLSPIEVGCDAVVNTHGWSGSFITVADDAKVMKIDGKYTYIDGPTTLDTTVTEITAASRSEAYVSGEGLINGVSEINTGSFNTYKINPESGEGFYAITPAATYSGINTYNAVTFPSKQLSTSAYAIFEMDVATESEFIDEWYLATIIRDSDNRFGDSTADTSIYPASYVSPSDKWARISVIYDFGENLQHVFVNGRLVSSTAGAFNSGTVGNNGGIGNFTISSIRISVSQNSSFELDESIFYDNYYFNFHATDDSDIESSIADGSLAKYYAKLDNTPTTRQGEALPAIANINGKDYGNLITIRNELSYDKAHVVYLERPLVSAMHIVAGSDTVIALNGIEASSVQTSAGYTLTSDGGIVYVVLSETDGTVQVIVNGTVIFDEVVTPGTDIAAILAERGSYGDKVVVSGGYIFTNVTWQKAPAIADGPTSYIGSGTQFTGGFYVHTDGVKASYTDDSNGLKAVLASSNVRYDIILAEDMTLPALVSVSAYTRRIYLNGHDLTFPNPDHCFRLSNSSQLSITGPGAINNLNSNDTHGLFFSDQTSGTVLVTLKNLKINASQAVSQMRAGTMIIENCDIDALATYKSSGNLFMLGHNAATQPVNLIIRDSDINYRYVTSSEVALFKVENIRGIGTSRGSSISIEGSTITAEGPLLQASTLSGTAAAEGDYSDFMFSVKDSRIVASKLYLGNVCVGTVLFENNVSVGTVMTSHETMKKVTLADGIVAAKTNDHLASTFYTSDYATVMWPDGSTEFWANGTTPVNASKPFTKVEKVEGGRSYDLIYSYASNPASGIQFNLTLSSSIGYNIYVPMISNVSSIEVGGKRLEASIKKINGTAYMCYTLPLSPIEASSAFDVILHLSDGCTIARKLSVADYARALISGNASESAKTLAANMLAYVKASAKYFGINADTKEIDNVLALRAATTFTIPTSSASATAIENYLSTVQLNLLSTFKFRFNVKDGAAVDTSSVKVTVGGKEKEIEAYSSYIEVSLNAYEMTELLTVTVNGASGTFDLAKYCNAISGTPTNPSSLTNAEQGRYYTFNTKHKMSSIIYSYAEAAQAYVATLETV